MKQTNNRANSGSKDCGSAKNCGSAKKGGCCTKSEKKSSKETD